MGRYSKLIAALVGNVVGFALVYTATNWPAVATCGVVDGVETCTVLGYGQAELTGFVMVAINALLVYAFPPNKPPA